MHYCRSKRIRVEKDNESMKKISKNIEYKKSISTIHDLCSDIWLEIFEYFETIELFTTLPRITNVTCDLLLKNNEHFYPRGLVLDADFKFFSEQIPLHRIISVTLHEEFNFQIIDQFSKLRSLKLTGEMKWITSIIKNIAHKEIKLEQLSIVTLRIESLQELVSTVSSITSLHRLEVSVEELEKKDMMSKSILVPNKIEQFILNSSSSIDCGSLFYILPHSPNIRLLDIGLIGHHQKIIPLLFSENLRSLTLSLLEVPFIWIIHLLEKPNSVMKLKLSGLVHDENFIINENWIHLFELTSSLIRIFVNLSLEQDKEFYYYEKFQMRLRLINLQLTCISDNDDSYEYYGNEHRWWSLKGMMIKS